MIGGSTSESRSPDYGHQDVRQFRVVLQDSQRKPPACLRSAPEKGVRRGRAQIRERLWQRDFSHRGFEVWLEIAHRLGHLPVRELQQELERRDRRERYRREARPAVTRIRLGEVLIAPQPSIKL